MADDALANNCSFQWDIRHPFLPGRDLEATFYQGSPTITQWKLTLHPRDRGQDYRKYLAFVAFDETNNDRSEIVAKRIRISMELDGRTVFNQQESDYKLCPWNRCRFTSGPAIFSYDQTVEHRLVIKVDISLPGEARENENFIISRAECLQSLSEDLRKLLMEEESPDRCPNYYRNLNLLARNDPQPIRAHSYVLHARWNNFFRKHALQNTVQTNISRAVLIDILTYAYTGEFSLNWPIWTNHAYISELFHVINWYGLYHLHKVFVKSDLQQLRVTRNPVIMESRLYPVKPIRNQKINDITLTWRVEKHPELTFRLIFRYENQAGPWLSYTLQSTSLAEVRANVNLAFVNKMVGNDEFIYPFHDLDHTVRPHETVESRYVLFLGCPETFGFCWVNTYIQCYLKVTDGTTIDQIQSADDPTLQNIRSRWVVLSDHMRQLQNKSFGTDMTIRGRSRERNPQTYPFHKGIFVGRCPDWVEGLENEIGDVPPEIPENPICTLDSDYLSFVLDYMYTGKVFTVIYDQAVISFRDLREFASRTGFRALANLMESRSMSRHSIDLDIHPDLEPLDNVDRGRYGRLHFGEDLLVGDVARGVVEEEDFIGVELQRAGIIR